VTFLCDSDEAPLVAFEWLHLLDGSHALAVGRDRDAKVYHYARSRSTQSPFLLRWEEMACVAPSAEHTPYVQPASSSFPSPPVGAMSCSSSGVLLLACGPQIAIFPPHGREGPGLLQSALAESCALPAYHPLVLLELMSASRFLPAIAILRHLLRTLRALPSSTAAGGSQPLFVPDLPFSELLPLVLDQGLSGYLLAPSLPPSKETSS